MMAYSTPAMVRKALVPSSDGSVPETPTNTAADFTDAQLADAIAEADATIDGLVGGYYAVPVAAVGNPLAVPHPIDYWSRNLAAYNATLTYRGSLDFADQDPVARRYNATMEALSAVSKGQMTLQIPGNVTDHGIVGAGSAINPYTGTLFTLDEFDLLPPGTPQGFGPYWHRQ